MGLKTIILLENNVKYNCYSLNFIFEFWFGLGFSRWLFVFFLQAQVKCSK